MRTFLLLFLTLSLMVGPLLAGPNLGLVVEKVEKGGGGEAAGIREGDVLLEWESEETEQAKGEFRSPYDVRKFDVTQAPLGKSTLRFKRDGKLATAEVNGRQLDLEVRPAFKSSDRHEYLNARQMVDNALFEEGIEEGMDMLEGLANRMIRENKRNGCWLLAEMAATYARKNNWERSTDLLNQALHSSQDDWQTQAELLEHQGNVAGAKHKYDKAQEYLNRALTLRKTHNDEALAVSQTLQDLARVNHIPGDFNMARSLYHESLQIQANQSRDSISMARTYNGIGDMAFETGDLDAAEAYYRKAYNIASRREPHSRLHSKTLNHLGDVVRSSGNKAEAQTLFRKAQGISEQVNPRSMENALSMHRLARDEGNPQAARTKLNKALHIIQELAPSGLEEAEVIASLAELAEHNGDLTGAAAFYSRAKTIVEAVAPESLIHARLLNALGSLKKRNHQYTDSLTYFDQARRLIEVHANKMGNAEQKTHFSAKYRASYRESIEVMVALNKTAEAFVVLESYRSRAFFSYLDDRDLRFTTRISRELMERRDHLSSRLAQHEEEFRKAELMGDPLDMARINRDMARTELDQVLDEIRKVQDKGSIPKPINYGELVKKLDHKNLLLSYLCHDDKTYLFVGTRNDSCKVVVQNIGKKELTQLIGDFRRYMTNPKSALARQKMTKAGARLYNILIEPIASQLATSNRLLIIPDGPLHKLPFGALAPQNGKYLGLQLPLSLHNSATVYAAVMQRGTYTPPAKQRWVAFGDPLYPGQLPYAAEMQKYRTQLNAFDRRHQPLATTVRSTKWAALPFSRLEVEAIEHLAPNGGEVYLGEDANEAKLMELDHKVDVLHLACHGFFDTQDPLQSALALTPDNLNDDGYLYAAEIIEKLRLDARLVVLSACESGLGADMGGEGMIGLGRAFQHSGAESVMASLWRVPDLSTAYLMKRFYTYLSKSYDIDQALHFAQEELVAAGRKNGTDAAHPYYWASFQLYGDYRKVN